MYFSGNKWRRFSVYVTTAWLLPALLVSVLLTLDVTEAKTDFAPGYGKINCWLQNWRSLFLFVLAPVCLIMVCNMYFYTWTAWLIHTTRSEKLDKSRVRTDFRLFARLAVIMGLTWITGVIAAFANSIGKFITNIKQTLCRLLNLGYLTVG